MRKKIHVHSIDDYAYRSPLRSWNPALKVSSAVALLFLCLMANRLMVSVYIVITMAAANIGMNRIRVKEYLALLAIPVMFLVMGSAAIAIDLGFGETGWYLRVTSESVLKSLGVMMRAFGAVSALYFLTLSTPVSEVIGVLRKFHLPKLIVELMYMIYRYIFILLDAQARARSAAEARLGYTDFKTTCKTFGNSMGNLLVVSLKKSGMYYDAMVSRGYDGELLFWEDEKPVTAASAVAVCCYLITICIVSQIAGIVVFM